MPLTFSSLLLFLTLFLSSLTSSLSHFIALSLLMNSTWCLLIDACCRVSVCLKTQMKVKSSTHSWRLPSWCSCTEWPAPQTLFPVPSCTASSPPWWPPPSPLSRRHKYRHGFIIFINNANSSFVSHPQKNKRKSRISKWKCVTCFAPDS